MVMNIGNSYSMMGGMNPMMNGSPMGMSGNTLQTFQSKYGCEDCFRKQPYPYEFPKPYIEIAESAKRPSFWERLLTKITS